MRWFLEIAFHGKNYAGWQLQKQALSVQEVVERALSILLQQDTQVTGCGRTDAGVHARQYFLHFDTGTQPPEDFLVRLNKILPKDIAARKLLRVRDDAHARFDATSRTYQYHIHFEKDPFLNGFSLFFPFLPLDFEAMHRAAHRIMSLEDFAPLSRKNPDLKTTLCRVTRSEIRLIKSRNQLVYTITANRFLHNMVRRIVGLLLNIGKGKITMEELDTVIQKGGRFSISLSVPPEGLYLTRITYPRRLFIRL